MANGIGRVGWRNYVSPVPTIWNNLTHYYSGDNTANDSKGTAHGTLVNGTLYGAAKINNGFDFDGINDYISFPTNTFKPTGDFSISFWFYKKNNNTAGYMSFTEIGQSYWGNGMFGYNYNGGFAFEVNGGRDIVTPFIPNDTWTHIVITHKDSTNYKIYTNGVLATPVSGNYANSINTSVNPNFSSNNIAMTINSVAGGGYVGATKMDEIALFDGTELTATQVAEIYNAGSGLPYIVAAPSIITSGLVLNLDASNALSYSGTGTTWTDLSGNNINGTLMNGAAYSSANGGTLVLDGVNDYIAFNLGNYKTMFGTITSFSTWVKYTNVSGYTAIFGDWNSSGADESARFALNGYGNVPGKISGYIMSNGGGGDSSTTTILPNVWYHYSMTYDGTTQKMYVNGVLEAQSTHSIAANGTGKFAIGRGGDYSGLYAPINISNFQVYNRALSSTEVTQNFNAAKTRFGL